MRSEKSAEKGVERSTNKSAEKRAKESVKTRRETSPGFLHALGSPLHNQVSTHWNVFILFCQTLSRLPKLSSWRKDEILQSVVSSGIGSLSIVVLATAFAGILITNELAWHMDTALHTVSMIPGFSGQFVLRELGVAIPALLLVSKVGAATTAEIGTMKVTEQIDALKLLGIDPVGYLVFPRFIASIISSTCLTLIAIGMTLICAMGMAIVRYNFSMLEYLNALRHFVGVGDLFCALIKGIVFGAIIPVIACAYGFRCKGGAEGVGTATTDSVVSATISVILWDFILTYFFTSVL